MSTVVENLDLEFNISRTEPELRLSQCFGPRIDEFLGQTFPQLFAKQVLRDPAQVAVVSEDGQLTYGELNARANRVANALRRREVGRESLIGICIDRSLDMAVGILGILKAGAAYLPLDPDYPAERLTWLLNDSGVALVVTKMELASRLNGGKAEVVLLDAGNTDEQDVDEFDYVPAPKDLAYVIYTSGSTGQPKGVMIEHANLANYLLALQHEFQLEPNDRYLHTASISFSSSRRQLLLPLSLGATVVIASSEQRKDPIALFEMIKQREVTVMDAVPSFWRNCTEVLASLSDQKRSGLLSNHLRLMLSASEPLLTDIPYTWMHKFAHPARHIHMFGQTETAGIVCIYRIPENLDEQVTAVPIGAPVANTEIYILDERGRPAPMGTPGELYIGGAGVGRGYLDRPEYSAHKFLPPLTGARTGARLYRTGDFARLTSEGVIEFAGRQDSQVKMRGFRIELGEIEATLARHPGIKETVVVARDAENGSKTLVAYFVGRETVPGVSELRTFLTDRLPEYMVPATFVQIAALPLTANGKIDKRALPDPGAERPALATIYKAPSTTTEKQVAEIWTTVLRLDAIGVNDDFFELGGHSLLAIQVVARINEQFKIELPLRNFFEHSTISSLATQVEVFASKEAPAIVSLARVNRDQPLPLSFPQQRLWFIDQLDAGSPLYNINKALRLRGELDTDRLNRAAQAIAARHEILRTNFVVDDDGRPFQLISPQIEIPFHVVNLTAFPSGERQAELDRLIKLETERPFDLAHGSLLRLHLFRLAANEHVLLLSIHHIISDAWTLTIFFSELKKFYESASETLAALPIQYADFADWQRRQAETPGFTEQLDYWKAQLKNAPLSTNLPSDFSMPAIPSFRGAQRAITLPSQLVESLRQICRQENVTLFMLLLGAFQILLSVYSGLDDVLVGTPIAGRNLMETEPLIGCFINTLVLRGNLSGNPSFREVLNRTRALAIDAYTHQAVPFEKLVEELSPERNLSRSPLFQTMFVLEAEPPAEFQVEGIETERIRLETSTAKFDLTLGAVEKPDSLEIWLSYSTDLFADASAVAMLNDFQQLLEAIVADPEQSISSVTPLRWQPRVPAGENCGAQANLGVNSKTEFVAPRTPIEERLAGIWSDVLRLEHVGVLDNFFELGGHSLLAAQVISRARTALAVELPLRRIFETPTIAGLAAAIYEMQTDETEDEELAAMLAELSQLSEEEAQRRSTEEF